MGRGTIGFSDGFPGELMAIVLVLVVLVAIGGGVAFFVKSKGDRTDAPGGGSGSGSPAAGGGVRRATPSTPATPKTPSAEDPAVRIPTVSTGLPAKPLPRAAASAAEAGRAETTTAAAPEAATRVEPATPAPTERTAAGAAAELEEPSPFAAAPSFLPDEQHDVDGPSVTGTAAADVSSAAAEPPTAQVPAPAGAGGASPPVAAAEDDDEADDEAFDRFGAPGTRAKKVDAKLTTPMAQWSSRNDATADGSPSALGSEAQPMADVDAVAVADAGSQPVAEAEPQPAEVVSQPAEVVPQVEAEPEPVAQVVAQVEAEPEPVAQVVAQVEADLEAEPEPAAEAEPAAAAAQNEADPTPATDDDTVIELVDDEASPGPGDAVDHVLQALIERARDRQVGVAQVAAELVEQADLEDRELDEVFGDLIGRTTEDGEERVTELTLFSDQVPQRPGQLTDFARLSGKDKKRALIRVLCLLVALQEDGELRTADVTVEVGEGGGLEEDERAWPLARAVWPVRPDAETEDPDMPRRAKKDRRLSRSRGVA